MGKKEHFAQPKKKNKENNLAKQSQHTKKEAQQGEKINRRKGKKDLHNRKRLEKSV